MIERKEIAFSIIIPTYNRADKLERCLMSLEKQTYRKFEVLVCDDGSSDNTREVISQFIDRGLNLKYFYNENWGGPAYPRNKGIDEASHEWLCFVDSDDWWYPEKLEMVRKFCDDCTDLIYHDFDIYVETQKTGRQHKGRTICSPVFEDLFINDNCIVNSSVCVRKELLKKAGLFSLDRGLIAMEDYDLWLKCGRLSNNFKYVPHSLGGYDATGEDNISVTGERQLQRIDYIYNAHIDFLDTRLLKSRAYVNWAYKRALVYKQMGDGKNARRFFRVAASSSNLRIRTKSIIHLVKLIVGLG